MKWTLYIGEAATREGRFESRREAIRWARHSTEPGDFFFLIGRSSLGLGSQPARRLLAFRRDETQLLDTDAWPLGAEVDLIKETLQ